MKQLSGLDAGFLYMETPTTYGHVNSLSIYKRSRAKGFDPYELVRDHITARLPDLEPLRRRLVEVPLQLDHPWWIDDPDFDIDLHLNRVTVDRPGGDAELADVVGRCIGRRLDRTRPLWDAHIIEGLRGDRWGLLLKLHHATVDGASGAELMSMLLETKPIASPPSADGPPPVGEQPPTPAEMLVRTAAGLAMRPERLVRAQLRAATEVGAIASRHGGQLLRAGLHAGARALANTIAPGTPESAEPAEPDRPDRPEPRPTRFPIRAAPPTPFNHSISPHRRYAFRSTSLDDVKDVKNALGVTVNDVVMTVCAGGVRRYLLAHESPVDRPLMAMVPVSVRTGDEEERWTNRVSAVFVPLPVHLEDPADRLELMHKAMVEAKSGFDFVPASALQDITQFSPPAVFTQAAALATRMRLADRVAGPVNLVISNVPGPRQPLYLGRSRMQHYYPVSTIGEGMGLNITVQSYESKLDYGLVACRDLVPDLWDLMELIVEAQQELIDLAGTAS